MGFVLWMSLEVKLKLACCGAELLCLSFSPPGFEPSVADQHHYDADPNPDPICHFGSDRDPDPACHFDADPDPCFQLKDQSLAKLLIFHTF